jgi:hypothetical protein
MNNLTKARMKALIWRCGLSQLKNAVFKTRPGDLDPTNVSPNLGFLRRHRRYKSLPSLFKHERRLVDFQGLDGEKPRVSSNPISCFE